MSRITLTRLQKMLLTLICATTIGFLYPAVVFSEAAPVRGPQVLIIDAYNVYSPNVVPWQGAYRMHFGGWLTREQIHDNLYVADCYVGTSGPTCGNIRETLDAVAYGFDHINDPFVITVAAGNYVMYTTGLSQGRDWQTENNIYYSTSPAGDGLNWSPPRQLVSGYWGASAVINPDTTISLYINVNSADEHNYDFKLFKLDASGSVIISGPHTVLIDGSPTHNNNVDVRYNSQTHEYEMLAQRPSGPDGTEHVIDYLTSLDGLNFYLKTANVVVADRGEYAVWTPSATPNNPYLVFFGSTAANKNSTEFKIRAQSWSPPPTLASTVSLDANGVDALAIYRGDQYALNWSSSNVTSCSHSYTSTDGLWGRYDIVPNSAGSGITGLIGSYTMTCVGDSGQSISKTVQITQLNNPPNGNLDAISTSGLLYGWAYDPDAVSQNIAVHIYMDGPAGAGGEFIASVTANESRPDVNTALGISGDHGFSWQIPAQYVSGAHTWYVYGIDSTGGHNPLLAGSPASSVVSNGIIQGYKILSGSDTSNVPVAIANQPVSAEGVFTGTTNPYSYSLTTGRSYTMSVPALPGYSIGYTLCIDSTTCHTSVPTPGNSAPVNLPAGSGHYADLWWHYTSTAIDTPTATLTANGSKEITVNAGDPIIYAWTSTNAVVATSTFTVDTPDTCNSGSGPFPWVANTLSGTAETAYSTTFDCQAGHTYTITYTVIGVDNQKASDSIMVHVNASPQLKQTPTATLTANGERAISVSPGSIISYAWSSTNATAARGTYTTDSPACGLSGRGPFTLPLAINLAGSGKFFVLPCQAGHTITITYTVMGTDDSTASASVIVRVSSASVSSQTAAALLSIKSILAQIENYLQSKI